MNYHLFKLKTITVLFLLNISFTAFSQTQWETKINLESLFPSYIISTATINKDYITEKKSETYCGDLNGQIGFEVVSPTNDCAFVAEIFSAKFIRKSVIEGRLPVAGQKYKIYPEIDYDYDALYSVSEPVPETLTFKLALAGQAVDTKKQTVQIRSIHDCVYAVKKEDGSTARCVWAFAAYVNENHPLVEKILKSALDLKLVDNFTGYQRGPKNVYDQVFAVWNVLQRQGIKYSNIPTTSAVSERVVSQHVRFISESVANTQANCVDGSVLFASIFRKIGLKTFLALTPKHCLMGVVAQNEPRKTIFIETTMIGNVDLKKPSLARGLNSFLSGRDNNLSRTSFEQSCQMGAKEIQEAESHFGKTPGYYLIDLDQARAMGIQPLKSLRR